MSFLDLSDKYITNNKFLLWFPFKASDTNLKMQLEKYSADDSHLNNLIRILRRNEQKASARRDTKKNYMKEANNIISDLMSDSGLVRSKADAAICRGGDTKSPSSEDQAPKEQSEKQSAKNSHNKEKLIRNNIEKNKVKESNVSDLKGDSDLVRSKADAAICRSGDTKPSSSEDQSPEGKLKSVWKILNKPKRKRLAKAKNKQLNNY
jgi:hypothetical protein